MTDIEDASVNGNGEPLETTPETPKSAEPDAASPAAQPLHPQPGIRSEAGDRAHAAVADAEELVAEAPEVAVIAVARAGPRRVDATASAIGVARPANGDRRAARGRRAA